ncbi:MAG: hypothetical protein IPO42_10800 [Chitinophagaceae bacterium]|nr:hypothetical protein [Chitinophagaceae bacterium]
MNTIYGLEECTRGWGEQIFGMKTIADKTVSIMEGLKFNPEAKNDMSYFLLI